MTLVCELYLVENGSRDEGLSHVESNMEQNSSIQETQALRMYSHDPASSTCEPTLWDNSDVDNESETTTDDHLASAGPAAQQEAVMNEDDEMQQLLLHNGKCRKPFPLSVSIFVVADLSIY